MPKKGNLSNNILVTIPIITGAIFWIIGVRYDNFIIPVFVSAMPVGMNVVVFLQGNDKNTYLVKSNTGWKI